MPREHDEDLDRSRGDENREYFSACDDGEDLRNKAVGDTFDLCQAGYTDRKLFYNTWTR